MALNFPASPTIGQSFSSSYATYTWNGSSWTTSEIITSNTGAYLLNSNTVSSNVIIQNGYNALSVGPLNIANNVNVSVSTGSRWLIL